MCEMRIGTWALPTVCKTAHLVIDEKEVTYLINPVVVALNDGRRRLESATVGSKMQWQSRCGRVWNSRGSKSEGKGNGLGSGKRCKPCIRLEKRFGLKVFDGQKVSSENEEW